MRLLVLESSSLKEKARETLEKKRIEKWPRGRRGADTKPKIEESFHIHVTGIEEREPEGELRVGWGNSVLNTPTYRLFYEYSVNCYFEKEGLGEYSFAWPTVETKERVSVLLNLYGIELEELVE